jgi:hypothetical protein
MQKASDPSEEQDATMRERALPHIDTAHAGDPTCAPRGIAPPLHKSLYCLKIYEEKVSRDNQERGGSKVE